MKFKIKNEKEEKVVKAIRFSRELSDKLEKEAKKSGVSFSRFVVEACKFAIEHMEE